MSSSPTATIHKYRASNQFYEENLSENVNLRMMLIPAGEFLMGSPDSELERSENEGPQHLVSISSFFMGKYPVTQMQWRIVAQMPAIERKLETDPSHFKGDIRPVEQVSWEDAIEFCARLSKHTKRQYRLPTEAEWEYACRAGTTSPFHFGEILFPDYSNYRSNVGNHETIFQEIRIVNRQESTPVTYFDVANMHGLCDMHGNIWEWCQDCWHNNYVGAPSDGTAWANKNDGSSHIVRGGSWLNLPRDCRSAARDFSKSDSTTYSVGFRIVCSGPTILE
jgi:formylglycine-generating enzyme required for sulfatase activity